MTPGINLISALIGTRSRTAFREVVPDLFGSAEELAAWAVLSEHVRRYGDFPTVEHLASRGIQLTPVTQPVQFYIDECVRRRKYQAIRGDWQDLQEAVRNQDPDAALRLMSGIIADARLSSTRADTLNITDAIQLVIEDHDEARMISGLRGIPFGWETLDTATDGMQAGDLITLVARPGMGKSWLMAYSALHAWSQGHSVLFATMEMTVIGIVRRMLAYLTQTNFRDLRAGELSNWGRDLMIQRIADLQGRAPFTVLAGNLHKSTGQIDSVVQELEPDLVAVDAAYLLYPEKKVRSNGSKWETLEAVNTELKDVALNRNRPVLQSVQFNRSQKRDEEGDLDNIGGTDAIGQLSSVIIAPREGNGAAKRTQRRMNTAKVRDGSPVEFTCNFLFNPLNFDEIEVNELEQAEGFEVAEEEGLAL